MKTVPNLFLFIATMSIVTSGCVNNHELYFSNSSDEDVFIIVTIDGVEIYAGNIKASNISDKYMKSQQFLPEIDTKFTVCATEASSHLQTCSECFSKDLSYILVSAWSTYRNTKSRIDTVDHTSSHLKLSIKCVTSEESRYVKD